MKIYGNFILSFYFFLVIKIAYALYPLDTKVIVSNDNMA